MYIVHAKNVNDALISGLELMNRVGETEETRNGPVMVAPRPVATEYTFPRERVLFSAERDANVYFHFFESLWMLAGRNDLLFPLNFNSGFGAYSDDGKTLHGAYGNRWINHFGVDQVRLIIEELKKNPSSRRCVLAMWDPRSDLCLDGKDFPCNTHIYFRVKDRRLYMTVCCRSNDMIWGAYGANAFHMSFLQEVMAGAIGVDIGTYTQVSNNYHIYLKQHGKWLNSPKLLGSCDTYYDSREVIPYPIITTSLDVWMKDLNLFFCNPFRPAHHYTDRFFEKVASPLCKSWFNRKNRISDGLSELEDVEASDIKKAAIEWIVRRQVKETGEEGRPQ